LHASEFALKHDHGGEVPGLAVVHAASVPQELDRATDESAEAEATGPHQYRALPSAPHHDGA
jgi:hypothetical protein